MLPEVDCSAVIATTRIRLDEVKKNVPFDPVVSQLLRQCEGTDACIDRLAVTPRSEMVGGLVQQHQREASFVA